MSDVRRRETSCLRRLDKIALHRRRILMAARCGEGHGEGLAEVDIRFELLHQRVGDFQRASAIAHRRVGSRGQDASQRVRENGDWWKRLHVLDKAVSSLAVPVHLDQRHRLAEVGVDVRGVDPENLPVGVERALGLADAAKADGEAEPRVGVGRLQAEGLLEGGDRLAVAARGLQQDAEWLRMIRSNCSAAPAGSSMT